MSSNTENIPLANWQRFMLLFAGVILSILLFTFRGGFNSQSPLEQLARRAIQPDIALSNGKPSVFEFYADWCEACREMAPVMLNIEKAYESKLDVVLLNVDNIRWRDLINKYNVTGIPQLSLFDSNGNLKGTALGVLNEEELSGLISALMENKVLPLYTDKDKIYKFESDYIKTTEIKFNATKISPRSHS